MTPRPIPTSVRALLPLCGAENDHEALGACRGIGRKLQAAGLDWHALAAAIPVGDVIDNNVNNDKAGDTSQIRPFDAYAWKRAYTPKQEVEHRKRIQFCLSRPWCFSAKERAFLSGIEKLRGNLTIRQGDWLAALTDRLDQELRTA